MSKIASPCFSSVSICLASSYRAELMTYIIYLQSGEALKPPPRRPISLCRFEAGAFPLGESERNSVKSRCHCRIKALVGTTILTCRFWLSLFSRRCAAIKATRVLPEPVAACTMPLPLFANHLVRHSSCQP